MVDLAVALAYSKVNNKCNEIKHMFNLWLDTRESSLVQRMPSILMQKLIFWAEDCLGKDKIRELINGLV